jgi:PIN domain nuclease of toxin-antitoxin system
VIQEILFLASIWEIAIKISLGKLQIPKPLSAFVEEDVTGNAVQIMNIALKHVVHLENLPLHHRDPFDRLLVSQSVSEGMPIISSDATFDRYAVKRIW